MADITLQSIKFPNLPNRYIVPQIDNTLTQAGRPADAKVVGDGLAAVNTDITDLKADLDVLYHEDKISYTSGADVTTNFQFNANTTYFLKVSTSVARIQIKDSNDNVISDWTNATGTKTVNIGATAGAKIRIAYPAGNGTLSIVSGDSIIPEMQNDIIQIENDITETTDLLDAMVNLKVCTATENGDYSFPFTFVSGKKYILKNTVRIASANIRQGSTNVQTIKQSFDPQEFVFTATGNGDNLRLYFSDAGAVQISAADTYTGESKAETIENTEKLTRVSFQNDYAGKTMCVIGDSLSYGSNVPSGYTWHDIIKARYNLSSVEVLASVGASYSIDGTQSNPRFTSVVTTITGTPDIIVVFGGTNDYSRDVTVGNVDQTASNANGADFCAAVKYTLEYLTEHYPLAKIIYITPLQRNYLTDGGFNAVNDAGAYLYEYVNAIKQLANIYGVALCDLYNDSQFHMYSSDFIEEYFASVTYPQGDGLHPNADGTALYTNNGIIPTFDKVLLKENDFVSGLINA